MTSIIENLKKGQNLSFEESKLLFTELMEGKHEESSIIQILESFLKKGETKDEIAGGIFILRDKAIKVKTDQFMMPTWGLIVVLIICFIVLKKLIYIPDPKRDKK